MSKIKKITAREIYDSRGNPTVETTVILDQGIIATASVPSGASTGLHEACELRDDDGFGVKTAVDNIKEISLILAGDDVFDIAFIDKKIIDLDGTPNKSRLGANAILGVSLACARAASFAKKMELYEYLREYYEFNREYVAPKPFLNILNGGRHADNNLDIQEMMVVPVMSDNFTTRFEAGVKVYHTLKKVLRGKSLATMIGDEGGFAPYLENNEAGISLLVEAISLAGFKPGKDVMIALDVAATEFYKKEENIYFLKSEEKSLKSSGLAGMYYQWLNDYPIFSIEDPLSEDDFDGWEALVQRLEKVNGKNIQIIGDDLLVTNPQRIKVAIDRKLANGAIIKVNQIGTLTESVEAIKLLQKARWQPIISHRSGETTDDFIADLVVASGCGQIKTGAPARGERVVKYNRLLKIESKENNNG